MFYAFLALDVSTGYTMDAHNAYCTFKAIVLVLIQFNQMGMGPANLAEECSHLVRSATYLKSNFEWFQSCRWWEWWIEARRT